MVQFPATLRSYEGGYEYRTVRLWSPASTALTQQILTDEAEYGRWELTRNRLFAGGRQEILLRRRVIRVQSTLN